MKTWKHRAYKHKRIGEFLYQVNVPVDENIPEFEVVATKNGVVVSRATGWDCYDSHEDMINNIHSCLTDVDA